MTAAEWDSCTDPQRMLAFLRGKASARKWRLFAVACCRRLWHLLRHEDGRRVVEVAERFADGLADARELKSASNRAHLANSWPALCDLRGDALLKAGCPEDAELLLHLRGDAAHVRGCWAVDLLLKRE